MDTIQDFIANMPKMKSEYTPEQLRWMNAVISPPDLQFLVDAQNQQQNPWSTEPMRAPGSLRQLFTEDPKIARQQADAVGNALYGLARSALGVDASENVYNAWKEGNPEKMLPALGDLAMSGPVGPDDIGRLMGMALTSKAPAWLNSSKEFMNEMRSSRHISPDAERIPFLFTEGKPEIIDDVLRGKSGHPRNLVYFQEGGLHHNHPDKSVLVLDRSKIPDDLLSSNDDWAKSVGEFLIDASKIPKDAIVGRYKNNYELFDKGRQDLLDRLKAPTMIDNEQFGRVPQKQVDQMQADQLKKDLQELYRRNQR